MSDSVSFKFTLTKDEYYRAGWAYLLFERRWQILGVLVASAFCIVTVLTVATGVKIGTLNYWLLYLGGAVLLLAFFLWRAVGRYIKRTASKSPFVDIEYEMTFSPQGITSSSSLGTSEVQWSIYTGARETADFMLLGCGINLYYPFPKEALDNPEALDRFRDLIRAHVPNAKLLGRAKK